MDQIGVDPTERPRSFSHGSKDVLKIPGGSLSHAHSDEKVHRKGRPGPIKFAEDSTIIKVHDPYCHNTITLGSPDAQWLAELRPRLSSADEYTRLVAIKDGLSILDNVGESRIYLLNLIAKALDRVGLDAQCVFGGLKLPAEREGSSFQPCVFLRNIPALLDAFSNHLMNSPRYVFSLFRQQYFPTEHHGAGDRKGDEDVALEAREANMEQEFAEKIVPTAKSYSILDGWPDLKVNEEFKLLWNLLKDQQKTNVKRLLANRTSFIPINSEIYLIMGISEPI